MGGNESKPFNWGPYNDSQWSLINRAVGSMQEGLYSKAKGEFTAVDGSHHLVLRFTRDLRLQECDIGIIQQNAEDLMKQGSYHEAKVLCEQALQKLQSVIQEADRGTPVWEIFIRNEATRESLHLREPSINSNITKCDKYIIHKQATELLLQDNYVAALEKFESIYDYFRNEGSTLELIEKCKEGIVFDKIDGYMRDQSYDIAISELDSIRPSNAVAIDKIEKLKGQAYFGKAKSEYDLGQNPFHFLDEALKFNNSKEYWTFKAKIYKEHKKYTEAIRCANNALEIDGSFAEAKEIKYEAIKNNGQIIKDAFGGSELKTLSAEHLFAGIEVLEQIGYCDADKAPITMVIGSTRCGKSTTLNLLLGNSLVAKKEGVGLSEKTVLVKKNADPDNAYPVIGTKTTSETTIPTKYELDGMQLWDCPGFGDTRGPQQEIINAWFVNKLFTTASEVKLVNLCAATSFIGTDNVTEFTNYIRQIQDVFGRDHIAKIKPLLVFTKTQSEYSADEYKKICIELIEEHFPRDKEVQDFFRNAEVTKIDAIQAVGTELTQDSVPELTAKYGQLQHQSMHPYVGVDYSAKVFLERSIAELAIITIKSMKNIFKEESDQFFQKLKVKLAGIVAKDEAIVRSEVRGTVEESQKALFDNNEEVKIKLKYFDGLSKFITTLLDRPDGGNPISSAVENFRFILKTTLENDVGSIVENYLISDMLQTFGEYSWEHPCLLENLDTQVLNLLTTLGHSEVEEIFFGETALADPTTLMGLQFNEINDSTYEL
jgi:tetratricopeptide (TPR) repeat protein/GTPase SAR1 family protein